MEFFRMYNCGGRKNPNFFQNRCAQPKGLLDSSLYFGSFISRKISKTYQICGRFCAARFLLIILSYFAVFVILTSLAFLKGKLEVCGWNCNCAANKPLFDTTVMFGIRSGALVGVYVEAQRLRRYSSKNLLALMALYSTLSMFTFGAFIVFFVQGDLQCLGKACSVFVLLSDMDKPLQLAKYAFRGNSQKKVVDNVGLGMADVGPYMSLNLVSRLLSAGLALISGIPTVERLGLYSLVSLLVHWLAFTTLFPACLTLMAEVSNYSTHEELWHQKKERDMDLKPNPLGLSIQILMILALLVFFGQFCFTPEPTKASRKAFCQPIVPTCSLDQFYLARLKQRYVLLELLFYISEVLVLTSMFFWNDRQNLYVPSTKVANQNANSGLPGENVANQNVSSGLPGENVADRNGNMNASGSNLRHRVSKACVLKSSDPLTCATLHAEISSAAVETDTQPDSALPDLQEAANFKLVESGSSSGEEAGSPESLEAVKQSEELQPPTSETQPIRSLIECKRVLAANGAAALSDCELVQLVKVKSIRAHQLEKSVGNYVRGVSVRRMFVEDSIDKKGVLRNLPFEHYDYEYVGGACCENVLGYIPIPIGFAGPLLLDGQRYQIPMATTEGCLLASTNRGAQALTAGGGVHSETQDLGMTRAPCLSFSSAQRAGEARAWIADKDNLELLAEAFNSTSCYARLRGVRPSHLVGKRLYLRVSATTGDAMGMNMVGKGTEKLLFKLKEHFDDMEVIGLSGNYCTDKKAAAINWIEGRGKSVCCEAVIPAAAVKTICKTTAKALVNLHVSKNLVGSALAGTLGGNNAHAANIVAAIFIATGQDVAQTVESSNCLTHLELHGENEQDLYMSCTMPSLEVGTVGGGTVLPAQRSCLELLGVLGASQDKPGANACRLASIVCATVMAGELSLLSALTTNDLIKSHLRHNRSKLAFDETARRTALAAANGLSEKA